MTPNDIALIAIWFAGLLGTGIAMWRIKKSVRSASQINLDRASFDNAKTALDIVNDQLDELRQELGRVRGEMNALRAREGALIRRIQVLEATLIKNGIQVPPDVLN